MSRVRSLGRWLLLGLVLLLAVPAALVAVLATESGTAWLLRQSTELARPMGIDLEIARSRGTLLGRLELDGLVFAGAGTRFESQRMLLQWRPRALLERRLHIQVLELADIRVVPPAPGESAAAPPEIPDLVLPLALQLDRLAVERLEVVQPDGTLKIDRIALSADFDQRGLALRDLEYAGGGAQLAGLLNMQATAPHALSGEISAQIDQSLTGEDIGSIAAHATLAGTALGPQFDLTLRTPTVLHLRGALRLDQVQPGFDLSADWAELQWPLQGTPVASAQTGSLTLQGISSDYRLELQTSVSGEGLPATTVGLTAQGNEQGLMLQPLRLGALDGQLAVNGRVSWDKGLSWALDVLAERINPGLYMAEWPGQVGGRLNVSGSLAAEGSGALAVRVHIDEFGGQLRDYPVNASGVLDYSAGQLRAQAFRFASGPNRIALDGRADQRLDLAFDIKAPDLTSLYPGLAGRLEGAGTLSGTPQVPAVVASLAGQAIAYQDLRAQDIKLEIDWREGGGKGSATLTDVDAGGTQITRVTADLEGSPESHRVNLAAEAAVGSLGLRAQGGLRQQIWQGELQRLDLAEPTLGEWLLQSPARLTLGATEARAGQLCLTQGVTQLCTEGGWSSTEGLDLVGSLAALDLARLAPYLSGEMAVEGQLAADYKVKGAANRPSAVFELRPSDGLIRIEGDGEPLQIAYRNARVSGQFENDRGTADLRFELGEKGQAQGSLQLGPDKDGQRSLGGALDADFPDLSLVTGFVPALAQVEGRLHLEAALAGTLAAPRVSGALQILDAGAQVPVAGITLTDIGLTVRGDGSAPLRVDGKLRSGDGQIAIAGTLDPAAAGGAAVDLKLTGKDFQVARLPEALVLVSPDLRLQGRGPYHLSGKLLLPKAQVELKEVPAGTVAVSDDEIVVGEGAAEPPPAGPQMLTARVRVELGDAVTFKGFGLTTGLTGAVDASVDANGTGVDGKIELRDARYKSYGQDLEVERGRLLFAGPPANPDVDLRAVRVSRDGQVKAYLAMSGPLSKPRPKIYSEPALPESEALAYLLTGRGLSQASQQEGSSIASAALSLGLSKGEPLLQDLSDRLGLDELRVDSGEGGLQETSLVLGKYLNPDLYLGYTQGLFNPEGAVLLRLRLSKRLEVESRSGTQQSVDLFYRLEHD